MVIATDKRGGYRLCRWWWFFCSFWQVYTRYSIERAIQSSSFPRWYGQGRWPCWSNVVYVDGWQSIGEDRTVRNGENEEFCCRRVEIRKKFVTINTIKCLVAKIVRRLGSGERGCFEWIGWDKNLKSQRRQSWSRFQPNEQELPPVVPVLALSSSKASVSGNPTCTHAPSRLPLHSTLVPNRKEQYFVGRFARDFPVDIKFWMAPAPSNSLEEYKTSCCCCCGGHRPLTHLIYNNGRSNTSSVWRWKCGQ